MSQEASLTTGWVGIPPLQAPGPSHAPSESTELCVICDCDAETRPVSLQCQFSAQYGACHLPGH